MQNLSLLIIMYGLLQNNSFILMTELRIFLRGLWNFYKHILLILGMNNKFDTNDKIDTNIKVDTKTKFVHFWWIISIMALSIISMVSFILCQRTINANEIMEFVSYSSAILSITLSIFAIQYTYTSNVQIQQQFEKINSVADNIRGTANKLNLTSGKLEENLEVILKQLENIDASQKEMSSRINNLNNTQVGDFNISQNNYAQK